jgi:membrane protein CcdC involved in cytochrome C biogenesis
MDILSHQKQNPTQWSVVVFVTLCFWLSTSLVLDFVIIPSLMQAGMMSQPGFVSAGYSMFGIFNHLELLCAGIILTGVLILNKNHVFPKNQQQWSVILASALVGIAIICNYILTPQMSGLGLDLNWFDASSGMSAEMMELHAGYWGLELMKWIAGGILLGWSFRAWNPQETN